MVEKVISFAITNKTKSIPIHKVLINEGLIFLESLIIKNFKGKITPEILIKSIADSPSKMDPLFFKTEIPIAFDKKLSNEANSYAISFLENKTVDCKKVKAEIIVTNAQQIKHGLVLYAELTYKTFGGDNDSDNGPSPVNPNLYTKHELNT
jgi:hypothetical protein